MRDPETMHPPTSPPALRVAGLEHRYGTMPVLDNVSLDVRAGEFLTILGPSGSGKTTMLRVIGGFETPTRVDCLSIGGIDVRGLPANLRDVATVFQHYALFPHMSVGRNVEYGLKMRGLPPAARRAGAERALALVRLAERYNGKVQHLSGGERQRVALARSLATQPQILLLDEPMSALDEKLRREMQTEIRALQQKLCASFIQVTHSQDEALAMSDRIAVMNKGRIEQLGTPSDIFVRPATRFVAAFMGMSNLLRGTITGIEEACVRIACGAASFLGVWTGPAAPYMGQAVFAGIHPIHMKIAPPGVASNTGNTITGKPGSATYRGGTTELCLASPLGDLIVAIQGIWQGAETPVALTWNWQDCAIGPDAAE